jgi:threonine 3-dehydrogenase
VATLITGGTGFAGAELAHLLVDAGEEVVIFDRTIKHYRISKIENQIKTFQGDLGNESEIMNVVKNNKITEIYHLGAMLTIAAENNPWSAFRANIIGTYNILESARLFNIEKVLYTSSFGTFGLDIGEEITDTTLQRPTTFYGVSKLYGEGLGRFYRNKFGLDFRSIRYPAVIGPSVKTPGHWFNPLIENVILNKSADCPVSDNAVMPPSLFSQDAARATYQLLKAPKENIKTVNYNVVGINTILSAKEIEKALLKLVPGAVIKYTPDLHTEGQQKKMSQIKVMDDSCARKEWGWKPEYDTIEKMIAGFIKEMQGQ